jgi:uncharacterized membrane protein YgdD (TMEM256/DUF423 family)
MRWITIFAGLCAATGLMGLALGAHLHALAPEDVERVKLVGTLQLGIAALALSLTNRSGRLSVIAATLLLIGMALFGGAVSLLAWAHDHTLLMAAPVGGLLMMLGALLIMFTKPAAKA